MAEVKVIEVQIKSNLDGATSSVSKFKTGLKEATNQSKELSTTLQGSKQSEFIDKLGDGVGKLNPAFGAAVKGANGLILKMWEMVANPVGAILAGIVITAKFLYEAFQSSISGGKELKATFAAISTVGEQVKDAIFGLGRAIINVAAAAVKFISLDFKGAAQSMKDANKEATESYKQLGNAVDGTTFKIIRDLEKRKQANDKARKIQAVTQSETNKLLVQSREILTDETASLKDKKKALEEVTKAEISSSKEKTRIAAEDLKILKAKAVALGGEAEKKMKGEIREATIALNEAETENAMTGIKLNKQKKMLGRQEVADLKEKNDAIAAANKEANDKRIALEKEEKKRLEDEEKAKQELIGRQGAKARDEYEAAEKLIADAKKANEDALKTENQIKVEKENADFELKKANLLSKNLSIEEIEAEHKRKLTQLDNEFFAKEADNNIKATADAKAAADAQNATEQAKFDLKLSLLNQTASAIGGLGALFKKGTAAAKAAALAEIAIGSAVGLINGLDIAQKSAKGTGPAAAFAFPIFFATQVAAVFGAVNRAKGILSGGGGTAPSTRSGGGSTSSPSIATAAPNFNVVGASSTNQLAQTIGNQQNQPIKAYVVANDVTTQQGLDRNIVKSATIG
jgi:hypothetical protein